MPDNRSFLLKRAARSLFYSWIELVVYFPLAFLYWMSNTELGIAGLMLALAAFYAAGIVAGSLRLTALRWQEYGFAAVFSLLLSLPLGGLRLQGYILFGAGVFLILRGVRLVHGFWPELFTMRAYYVAFFLYFFIPLMTGNGYAKAPDLYLTMGLLSLASYLYYANHAHLKRAADEYQPTSTRAFSLQLNRSLVTLLFLFILGVAFCKQWLRGVGKIISYLENWIFSLLVVDWHSGFADWFMTHVKKGKSVDAKSNTDPIHKTHAEPYIRYLCIAVLSLILLFLLIMLVVYLYRKGKGLLSRRLPPGDIPEEEGYIDEIEKTGTLLGSMNEGWKSWFRRFRGRKPDWEAMSSRERVRYLYRSLLNKAGRQGFRHDPAMTPAETVAGLQREPFASGLQLEQLLKLYNPVRYGDIDPEDQAVSELKQQLEQRK